MIDWLFLFLLLAILFVLLLGYIYYETHVPKIEQVVIETPRLHGGQEIRILQVSDLHNIRLSDSFLEQLQTTQPDLIAVTGDLINGREPDFENVYRLFDHLREMSDSIFFVSGNNDWEHKRYLSLLADIRQRGAIVLNNKHQILTKRDLRLNIVGVDDPSKKRDDLDKAFTGVTDCDLYTVLLAHDPMIIRRSQQIPCDLILSGHTHGGQVRLPVIGALVAPGQRLFPHFDKGKFPINAHTLLYICSGLGTSKLPIRFLNRSQVTLLHIRGQ